MSQEVSYILGSILVVSLVSLGGISILSLTKTNLEKFLLYFVSFTVGALSANVFFHLLPETVEAWENVEAAFGLVLLGIVLSFLIEKYIHWHHCHTTECHHTHPVGTMMIIGDGVHNVIDGILIATSYLVDIQLGIATTIAVLLHEIPQEIGDFAVLLHSGYTRSQAILWNFLSALTAFLGAGAVLMLHENVHGIELILLPIVAGNFLYIAGSDLIPELHKESTAWKTIVQTLFLVAGIALIWGLSGGGHGH